MFHFKRPPRIRKTGSEPFQAKRARERASDPRGQLWQAWGCQQAGISTPCSLQVQLGPIPKAKSLTFGFQVFTVIKKRKVKKYPWWSGINILRFTTKAWIELKVGAKSHTATSVHFPPALLPSCLLLPLNILAGIFYSQPGTQGCKQSLNCQGRNQQVSRICLRKSYHVIHGALYFIMQASLQSSLIELLIFFKMTENSGRCQEQHFYSEALKGENEASS